MRDQATYQAVAAVAQKVSAVGGGAALGGGLTANEVAGFGGTVRLYSASGGLEAVWIKVVDLDGAEGSFHPPAARVVGAPVRLTPHNARCLAAALNAYADTHAETEVEL